MPPFSKKSLAGSSHPLAGMICLFGFFLHIVLSDPLLNAIGFHYSGNEGYFFEKIHPGTVFIFLSFLILLWDRGNPIRTLVQVVRQYPAFSVLLALYILIFIYLVLRSGPAGTAFIIDTHMTVPICALVLSYAPLSMCRKAVVFFVVIAVANSMIGLAEAIGKFRIFAYNPDWIILKEQYFRASALRGYPLNNAMFTSVALFIALAGRFSSLIKIFLVLVFMASLVAFGSRAALVFCVAGLAVLGIAKVREDLSISNLSMQRVFAMMAATILVPVCFAGFLMLLLDSSIGERLMAAAHWDESADSRLLALNVFHYMSGDEIMLGMSADRVANITDRMNAVVSLGGIENPWLLMLMYCGAVVFPFWLAATLAFMYRLMRNQPLVLQLAVLAYFLVASTSNSFGRKDSTYLIMVCAVICAARSLRGDKPPEPRARYLSSQTAH